MDQPAAPSLRNIWQLIIGPEAGQWAYDLMGAYVDPETQLALHGSSKTARNLVLGTAKRASVSIELHGSDGIPLQPDLVCSRVNAVVSALKTRGRLHSKVKLRLQRTQLPAWPLTLALSTLREASPHVHELVVDYRGTLPTSVLVTAGQCCPALTALTTTFAVVMPAAAHFPNLVQLHVGDCRDADKTAIGRSCAPYLPQLATFSSKTWYAPADSIHLLLNPTSTSMTLRTLDIPQVSLDDTTVCLLIEHAPRLEHLTVRDVSGVRSETHLQHPCQWRSLTLDWCLQLTEISYLPLPAGMTLTTGRILCYISTDEEVAAALAALARAEDVMFDVQCLSLDWDAADPEDNEAEAQPDPLGMGLDVMQAIPNLPPGVKVELCQWTMSDAAMHELQRLPRPGTLYLGDIEWLSDICYKPVLSFIPSSYQRVQIGHHLYNRELSMAQFRDMCFGAPVDRTAEHPLAISWRFHVLGNHDPSWAFELTEVQPIRQRMRESGLYPHVTVSSSVTSNRTDGSISHHLTNTAAGHC